MENNSSILKELITAQDAGEAVVLATVTKSRGSVPRHAGSKMLIYENGRFSGTVGGGEMESRVIEAAKLALVDGQARALPYKLVNPNEGDPGVCGGEMEIFIEPYLPPATVLVIGCGHVGQAVAQLAHWLGFRVAVTDDREDLASPDQIPEADVYLPGAFETAVANFTITRSTYITLVTRNVQVDRAILPLLVDTPACYIGVMGSKRRWETTRQMLVEDGLTEAQIERFHSPIGLELNAESPEEIAVSILAEIIKQRRQKLADK